MKILSLYVKSFGKLSNVNLNFRNGINVISDINGFGKTTMSNFIRAMLYGFTYTRVKGASDAARFAPWGSNDKFGGSIVIEHNGETYRIERYFGKLARNEELTVTNAVTNKAVQLTVSPGEFFLGLTADSFDRSAYFPQEAVEISSNDNFEAKLANLVENSDVDYEKVQKNLRDYRRTLKLERGDGGKIYELTLRQRQFERELNEAIRAERRSAEIDERLKEIKVSRQHLAAEQNGLKKQRDELKSRLASKSPSETDKANWEKLKSLEIKLSRVPSEIEQDKQRLDEIVNRIANIKDDVKSRIYPNITLLIISIILAIAGIVMCFVVPAPWGIIAGVAVAVVGVIVGVISFVKKGAKTLPAGEKDALITDYYRIAVKYIDVDNLDYNSVVKAFWKFYSDYSGDKRETETLRSVVKQPDSDLNELQRKVDYIERNIDSADDTLTAFAGEVGRLEQERLSLKFDIITPTEQIEKTKLEIAQARHCYDVAEKVSEILAEAKDRLSSNYLPRLCNRCQALLCQVTEKQYEVAIDRAFNIQLRENGYTKPMSEFSRGTREITLLCFRVALSELLYDGEIPFVIVDDAFVNFDEYNFVRATNLLKSIAERGQVIYFTCHKRTGNLLK